MIGREHAQRAVVAALDAITHRSSVLVVDAEPGMGKTTLLEFAAGHAVAAVQQALVLRCAPAAGEAALAYAALTDLFAPIDDLGVLDEPLRGGLEQALLRRPATDTSELDPRVVATATAAAWRAIVADRPLVVVADDAQWLDAASAAALDFALRRRPPAGLVAVVGRRSDPSAPGLPGAEQVHLGPLGSDAIGALVDAAAATPLGGQRARVVAAAGGNPLFAIELARHVTRRPATDRGDLPASLRAVVGDRITGRDPAAVEALAGVALLGRPDLPTVAALGWSAAIAAAEDDSVVTTRNGHVEFSHPLLAEVALGAVAPTRVRALHRRVAALVPDPDAAVRHAALGAEGPDAALAVLLAAAARRALERGAADGAAELAALAAELTPAGEVELAERTVTAAVLAYRAGDSAAATTWLDRATLLDLPERTHVEFLLIRAEIEFPVDSAAALATGLRALDLAVDGRQRVLAHSLVARVLYDNFDLAAQHAEQAFALAEGAALGDADRARVILAVAGTRLTSGAGFDRALFDQAVELEHGVRDADSAYGSLAAVLRIVDEPDEARAMLLEMLERCDAGTEPYLLSHLPMLEIGTGDWPRAQAYAERHLASARRSGQADQVDQAEYNLATLAIYRGDPAPARAYAARHLGGSSIAFEARGARGLLGLAAMASNDAAAAVAELTRWHELGEQLGLQEPGYRRLYPDLIEALVATGDLTGAETFTALLAEEAAHHDRPRLHGVVARMTALVAAARGDRATAVAAGTRAVAILTDTPFAVDLARARLTLGQVHRRFRERGAARRNLAEALTAFERIGATPYAVRARHDLDRAGGSPRAGEELSETEQRVAELAADGRTVRQIADALFISPKTAEANLTRVYRKLGLSGRAALATWRATAGARSTV